MPDADVDGVRIHYEVFGEPSDPLVVLIAGGGAQLIAWDERFVQLLVSHRLRVVRFDNRDTGFSQKFGGEDDLDGGYGLSDMAGDVLRILDHLAVASAHVVGHSMGAMIAQMLAIEHTERVRSLGLLSSIPARGPRYVLHGEPPERTGPIARRSREEAVALVEAAIAAAPRGRYDPQAAWHREAAATAYDRCYCPEGYARQWAALYRAPDRLEALRSVSVPTFVFHGRDDEELHWRSAVDTAEAIAGSELHVVPEMGHLIPHELWPEIVAGVVRTARRADHPV